KRGVRRRDTARGMSPGPGRRHPMGVAWVGLLSLEAVDSELVAIEVTGIGGVGILGPAARAGSAFVLCAGSQGGFMEGMDGSTVRRLEADGDAVTDRSRLAVGRLEYEEGRLVHTPDRAVVAQVGKA